MDDRDERLVAQEARVHPLGPSVERVELAQRGRGALRRVLDPRPGARVRRRVRRLEVRRAGREQRLVVGEVAVHGRAAHARALGDGADRRPRRAELLVQRDGALGDPQARLLLEVGAPRLAVGAFLIGHRCRMNILTDATDARTFSRDTTVRRKEGASMETTAVKIVGPQRRPGGLPREHRRPLHDRRGRGGRALLARRAPDVAARARRAAAPAHARGRVQLRARGAHGRAAGRRGRRGRARRPGLQAAQPVAHLLERGRRALPDPRDHLAGRVRALLPASSTTSAARSRPTPRPWPRSTSATAWRCSPTRCPGCSSASGCRSASSSPAAGRRRRASRGWTLLGVGAVAAGVASGS